MTRTAGGWRGRTRTRAVVDWEVADLPDESACPGRCGVSVNRCHTADRAEFRRRLLSGNMPCDGRSNFLDDVRTGDIGDHAQPTAAVRADRQIDRVRSHSERNADCDAISRILCAAAPSGSSVQSVQQDRPDDRHPAPAPQRVQPCAVGGFAATGSAPPHYDVWRWARGCRGISPGCRVVEAPAPPVGPKTQSARTQNGWCRPGTGCSPGTSCTRPFGQPAAVQIGSPTDLSAHIPPALPRSYSAVLAPGRRKP